MNRFCLGHHRYLFGSLFFALKENVHDRLDDPPEFIPQTGIERVYKEFSEPKPGQPSKALISLVQFVGASFTAGLVFGGVKGGNQAHEKFIIANQHAKFISPFEARRKLHDTVFLAFFRKGIPWGIKAALFTGVYCFCVLSIPAYRNKEGILEYAVGGALAGGLARLYLGVKATFAGATIASALATIIGTLAYLSSTPLSDIKDMQYGWYEWRKNKMDNIMKRTNEKKFGHEFPAVMALREARITAKDSGGYSEGERVFFVVPNPEEVAGSTEPTEDTAEVEDTKSNGQSSTPAAAVLPETTSTNT
ncbi:hypothetical protein V9T40_003470 [Parthenolecanium corni]|uniref:Complex I assembly factor TIMMDC1, mitochondrial n=1 Tax=Parthenolecanium corni TaxID=536013 RepID=A0AAN9Y8W8_9HEMI